jgi:F0F1-type ATP synthase assembly protein I
MNEGCAERRLIDLGGKVDDLRHEMKTEFATEREKRADERFKKSMDRLRAMGVLINWLAGIAVGLAIAVMLSQL